MLTKFQSIFVLLILASFKIYSAENDHNHIDDENFEDHASHEHGHATAQISFSNDTLNLELLLPSIDVFGFEHTPQNDEQREKIIQSKLLLQDANKILNIKPNKSCHSESVEIESVLINSISEENSHDHEERHDDEHHEDEHSDVNVHYIYRCSNAKPESIEFILFDYFPTVEEIEVQFVSDEAQTLSSATPDERIHSLK